MHSVDQAADALAIAGEQLLGNRCTRVTAPDGAKRLNPPLLARYAHVERLGLNTIGKHADEFRRDKWHITGDDRHERQSGRGQRARDAAHGTRRPFKVRHHARHKTAKRALLKIGKLAGTRGRHDQLAGNWRQPTQHALDERLATKRHARLIAAHARGQPTRLDDTRKIGTSYGSHTAKHLHRHARNPVHEAKYSRRNSGAMKSSYKNKTAPLRHAAGPRAQKRW